MNQTFLSVEIDRIFLDSSQPRQHFADEPLQRLAQSIRDRGILQPIRIVWDAEREVGRVVLGERRLRAAKLAGLTHVPCVLVEGEASEEDKLADQLVENSVRESLSPIEFATALTKLKRMRKCTAQQLAVELSISPSTVTRAEALLKLPDALQILVEAGSVPEATAYELSKVTNTALQLELGKLVAEKSLTRDEVSNEIRSHVGKRASRSKGCRLSCRIDQAITVTVSRNGQPLTKTDVLRVAERLRKEAKSYADTGENAVLTENATPTEA